MLHCVRTVFLYRIWSDNNRNVNGHIIPLETVVLSRPYPRCAPLPCAAGTGRTTGLRRIIIITPDLPPIICVRFFFFIYLLFFLLFRCTHISLSFSATTVFGRYQTVRHVSRTDCRRPDFYRVLAIYIYLYYVDTCGCAFAPWEIGCLIGRDNDNNIQRVMTAADTMRDADGRSIEIRVSDAISKMTCITLPSRGKSPRGLRVGIGALLKG